MGRRGERELGLDLALLGVAMPDSPWSLRLAKPPCAAERASDKRLGVA
jgi:hypothetical protein